MFWRNTLPCPTYLRPGGQLHLGLAYRGNHVGDLGRSQIMGSLGDPAIPKTAAMEAPLKSKKGMLGTIEFILGLIRVLFLP